LPSGMRIDVGVHFQIMPLSESSEAFFSSEQSGTSPAVQPPVDDVMNRG
jgi:hypothetical protein